MSRLERWLQTHNELTRRYFLQAGISGTALATTSLSVSLSKVLSAAERGAELPAGLDKVLAEMEPYLTSQDDFRDVSRGKPVPHSLPVETREQVGMTRDSWKLEVISDPDNKADIRNPLSRETGNPFDFAGLMELAKAHAVRFPKVMTCLNIGCPLGMGIWEGVPLREVFWKTQPRRDIRRVFYYGYHNDKPEQMFRSSLPLDRVLEDPFDLPPVILCYKLNGDWLTPERGGPVRMVVPEGYGFKSIKWLTHLVLTNLSHANDTYANGNNDVDSHLKSFAATLSIPTKAKAGEPLPISGYAQSGISGISKVQVWIHPDNKPLPENDPHLQTAPWVDATILSPPADWGGGLPNNKLPLPVHGMDPKTGEPKKWPLRLAKAHWAMLHPGLPAGEYTLHSRTVDEKGVGQPLPRPFRKSGHAAIEKKRIVVQAD